MCSPLWPIALSSTVPDASAARRAPGSVEQNRCRDESALRWGGVRPDPLGLTVTVRLAKTPGSNREVGAWERRFHRPWRDAFSQAPVWEPRPAVARMGGPM